MQFIPNVWQSRQICVILQCRDISLKDTSRAYAFEMWMKAFLCSLNDKTITDVDGAVGHGGESFVVSNNDEGLAELVA